MVVLMLAMLICSHTGTVTRILLLSGYMSFLTVLELVMGPVKVVCYHHTYVRVTLEIY